MKAQKFPESSDLQACTGRIPVNPKLQEVLLFLF